MDMRLGTISARESMNGAMELGIAGLLGTAGLLVASGWAVAEGHATAIFILAAVVGLCIMASTQRGVFIGVLLLVALNGLPLIDASRVIFAKYMVQDAAVGALLVVVMLWISRDSGTYRPSRIGQAISRAAVALLLWWLFTLVRSVIGQHVPTLHAASFGRDFLYFALLLILLPRARLTSRDIGALLGVLAVGVCVFAAGQIAIATGIGQPAELIHFEKTLQQSGLTRVYAPMTDLVTAGLAASVAAVLLARKRALRLVALPVALLLMTSTVVQLTRARWIGLIVGLLLVSLWLTIGDEARVATVLRRRLAIVVGALGVAGLAAFLTAPGLASSGTTGQRLLSIFSDLQSSSGTIAIREAVTRMMTVYLGGKWPLGLGFVPPSAHYFSGLPEGSIQDADLGVLNAVMTMGVVGAALLCFPVVFTLIHCLRRSSGRWRGQYAWLCYGGAVWIVATLASSVTLVTLFSTSGLALTAVFLTILAHPSVSGALAPSNAVGTQRVPHPSLPEGLAMRRARNAVTFTPTR
jgi:hypothetical protein